MSTALEIGRLRKQLEQMQDSMPRRSLEAHPALAEMVRLRAGGAYEVDGVGLAMALMSGPSRAGSWCAAVGVTDFGAEAAVELGVDLSRTVLVPDPGELWADVTGALVDVAELVVVQPTARVPAHLAEKIGARLRKRSSVLVAIGSWPRSEARFSAQARRWEGLGQGHGHLRTRRVVVSIQRGSAPARRARLWFPADDAPLRLAGPAAQPAAGSPAAGSAVVPVTEAS